MGLFKKKNNEHAPVNRSYQGWEQDLGFLTLVLTRNLNMAKIFFINNYTEQLDGNTFLKDRDIEPYLEKLTTEIFQSLSVNYVRFLIDKYFADEEKLIEFISDNVYMELLKYANDANIKKINKIYAHKTLEKINDLNAKTLNKK